MYKNTIYKNAIICVSIRECTYSYDNSDFVSLSLFFPTTS